MENKKKYHEGYFIGMGIAFGILFGLPLSMSLDSLGLVGIGLPVGLAIGVALEEKYKKEGRIIPVDENEKKRRRLSMIAGIGALILSIIVFLFFLLK